jgi:hypothetical protein
LRLSAEARNASGATIGAALRQAPIIGTLLMSECNAGPDCLFLK